MKEVRKEIINNSYAKGFTCAYCNKFYDEGDKTYLVFWGNVTLGLEDGVIGNNLNEEGKVVHITIMCIDCFKHYLGEGKK